MRRRSDEVEFEGAKWYNGIGSRVDPNCAEQGDGRYVSVEFEWDEDKAASNRKKHGIPFEEAASVFAVPLAALFDHEMHSEEEHREIIVGHSADNRLWLVSLTEREDAVRIISARRATRKERRDYEENPQG